MLEKRFVYWDQSRPSFDLLRSEYGAPLVRHVHRSPRKSDVLTPVQEGLEREKERVVPPYSFSPSEIETTNFVLKMKSILVDYQK